MSNISKLIADTTHYLEDNFHSESEIESINKFIDVLKSNDEEAIKWYTQFGTNPHNILMNEHTYLKLLECGYEGFELSEYGWIEANQYHINIINKVEFTNGKEHFVHNYYEVGVLPNRKLVYGRWYDLGGCGGGGLSGVSIWNEQFDTTEECESAALNWFKEKFEEAVKNNPNNVYCKKILSEINREIQVLDISIKYQAVFNHKNPTGQIKEAKPIQLQLF